MQMKKRVLSAFMALCMVCSLVGAAWAVIPQQTSAANESSDASFHIRWTEGWTTYFDVTVHYVDEGGNAIQRTQNANITIDENNTITFEDYAGDIGGYTYSGAKYEKYDGDTVTSMTAKEEGRYPTTRTLTFYNKNNQVKKLTYYGWGSSNADVYLVYSSNDTGGGDSGDGTVTQATVTTGKTAVVREDGDYDLTLSISGDRGSETTKAAVDVLFILDKSGSMDYKLNSNSDAAWYEDSRMNLLQEAVGTLVTTIESNDSIDARYAAVGFSGDGSGNHGKTTTQGWGNSSQITSYVNGLDPDGGTNYQRAIYEAKQLLRSARDGAITFVVFVSDGEPTYRGNDNDDGNGQNDNEGYNIAAAVTEISSMSCNYFYAIGMGPTFTSNGTGMTNLRSLANAVRASNGTGVYSATDEDSFTKAFEDITSSITFFAASDVTINDPLSQYADLVLGDNNSPQFTITVTRAAYTDSNGTQYPAQTWTTTQPVGNNGTLTFQDAEGDDVTVTASYNSPTKTITLDFPYDYELEEGYTYSISTVITPSRAAITAGMDSEAAQNTPDDNTGTHAASTPKQQGFWSNDNANAKVTYTANGENGSENFPKPVIQVQNGSLTVTKCVEDYVPGEDYAVTIDVKDSNSQSVATAVLDDFTPDNGVYKASHTFGNLSAGTYTVTETVSGVLTGYKQTSTVVVGDDEASAYNPDNPPSVTITAGQTQNVTFTNSYDVDVTVKPVTPDIHKYVDDKEDGTYDLSLDVTGTTVKDTKKLNVLYILDESYSMMWDMNGDFPYSDISSSTNSSSLKYGPNPGGDNKETEANEKGVPAGIEIQYSYERYQAAVNAINLLNQTLESNEALDVQYALVEFAASARIGQTWSESGAFNLPPTQYDTFQTGTNYAAALYQAESLLNQLQEPQGENAETIVVFITDGTPNRDGITDDEDSSSSSAEEGIEAAKKQLEDLDCDSFYAIGVSKDAGINNLNELIEAAPTGVEANAFESAETSELVSYFAQIASDISGSVTQDVTIMDELSEYAELVDPSTVPTFTIIDADGKPVQVTPPTSLTLNEATGSYTGTFTFIDKFNLNSSEGTVNVTYTYYPAGQYNNNTYPVITLEFPEGYQLTQDWTYTITLQIQPTVAAYDEYAQNIAGNKNGYGENTGDPNTDVPGSAESTWTSSGKDGFDSNTKADLTYTNGDGEEETADYPDPVIQVKFLDLVVAKQVTGNMGDTTRNFDFTLQLNRGDTYYTNTLIAGNSTLTATNNAYAFRLKNGESITIQVPARYAARVEETTTNLGYTVYAGYGETNAEENSKGDYSYIATPVNANPVTIASLDKGYTVLFTNERNVGTPTGFFEDNLPFTLMISAAGLAGIALIATILVRRQRRRRE